MNYTNKKKGLFFLICFFAVSSCCSSGSNQPNIIIDYISPYGQAGGIIRGHVTGVNPSEYVVYTYVYDEDWQGKSGIPDPYGINPSSNIKGVWFSIPRFYNNSYVNIKKDGTWKVNIDNDGIDRCVKKVAVYLIPINQTIDYAVEQQCAPCLEEPQPSVAIAQSLADRSPPVRILEWRGRVYEVKMSECRIGPGHNYFTDNEEDIYVDASGDLVLKTVPCENGWCSTEVIGTDSYGYGVYKFLFGSRFDRLDPNAIHTAFIWDTVAVPKDVRKINFLECALWGNSANPTDCQTVVRPYYQYPIFIDNCIHFVNNCISFNAPNDTSLLTVVSVWQPNQYDFFAYRGDYFDTVPPPDALIAEWSKIGGVPEPGQETVRFNNWLLNGQAPVSGQGSTFIVKNFSFSKDLPQPEIFITDVSPYGDPNGYVWGVVNGFSPEEYGVAVYIRVRNGWWTKPYWNAPFTAIQPNGSWGCDITTGGVDSEADQVAAFLIPITYDSPNMNGDGFLPTGLFQFYYDIVSRTP